MRLKRRVLDAAGVLEGGEVGVRIRDRVLKWEEVVRRSHIIEALLLVVQLVEMILKKRVLECKMVRVYRLWLLVWLRRLPPAAAGRAVTGRASVHNNE